MVPSGFLALGLAAVAGAPVSVPAELQGATLVDSIVARVDKQPITASQLELEARLALVEHGQIALGEGPLSGPLLLGALDDLVDQILLAGEAERLGVFEVTEEAAKSEVQKVKQQFSSAEAAQAFFERFNYPPDFVEGSVRRSLRANEYLRLHVQSKVGSNPGEMLTASRAFIGQLRAAADIRLIAHFGTPPPAPSDAGAHIAPSALNRP